MYISPKYILLNKYIYNYVYKTILEFSLPFTSLKHCNIMITSEY